VDQLGRLLDDAAGGITAEIARLEHTQGVGAEIDHGGTTCSDPASPKSVW